MSDGSIIKRDSIIKIKTAMTKLKTERNEILKDVDNIIINSTKNEKKALEEAYKNYTDKLNNVLKSKEVRDKISKQHDCDDKIEDLMIRVQSSFRKAIRKINEQPISDNEKKSRIKELGAALEDAILSEDEKEIMKVIKSQLSTLPFKSMKLVC